MSMMVSPNTDEESVECVTILHVFFKKPNICMSRMMPSPTKSVRFEKDVLPSVPLKGVLKKPEVVIPV